MGNIKLLKDVRDAILLDPKSHNQNTWVCETSMCIAGHATVMSGKAKFSNDINYGAILIDENGDYVSASVAGEEALGLTDLEREYLFYCMENVTSIKRMDQIISLWEDGKTLDEIDYDDWIKYDEDCDCGCLD